VVLADCVYGESSAFSSALEKRHLKYVLAIRSNHGAWLPAGSRIRQLSWRPFDRIFSNGEKQTRYIREIVFGWRRPVRFYLITIDPRTLPKDGTWFIITNLEGKIEKTVGNTYGFRTQDPRTASNRARTS
jgi:SRSO17 transposase